ncbi:MAG: serpin family protein [Parachlamydia sp.]|nr:serpin family protein [Parachlamydia sp.]
MRKICLLFAALLVLHVSMVLHAQENAPGTGEEEPAPPSKEVLLEDSLHGMVRGNNTFAYSLFAQLKANPGNLFFSPYCITSAMAIPYAGARSGTQNQIQGAMHYLPQMDNLDLSLAEFNKRLNKQVMQGPNEIKLLMANGLWVQRSFQLESEFLQRIRYYFGNIIRQVDFIHNAEAARLNINEWVREGTQGRITNIVDRGDIGPDTRLVVVSSIFMKAVWEFPFDSSLTSLTPFFLDAKTTLTVPMMNMTKRLRMMQQPQFTLLELPYSVGFQSPNQYAMYILLPHALDGIAQVENRVISGDFDDWIKSLQYERVLLSLPRFKYSTGFDLSAALKQMGMAGAFNDMADFTGIYAGGGLALSKVLHKAFISVDEKGTEAVAATAISINLTSASEEKPPVVFKADHPFVFIIVERASGVILFMGRYSTPTN